MPAADNKQLTRRWFEEVWNQGRQATIDELAAPDAVIHGLEDEGRDMSGPNEFRRFYHLIRSGLSDIHVTIGQVIGDADLTAIQFTLRATHSGDGLGVKATGRRVAATAIVMMRWKNGQIVEAWNEFDAAGLMRQIGADAPLAAAVAPGMTRAKVKA